MTFFSDQRLSVIELLVLIISFFSWFFWESQFFSHSKNVFLFSILPPINFFEFIKRKSHWESHRLKYSNYKFIFFILQFKVYTLYVERLWIFFFIYYVCLFIYFFSVYQFHVIIFKSNFEDYDAIYVCINLLSSHGCLLGSGFFGFSFNLVPRSIGDTINVIFQFARFRDEIKRSIRMKSLHRKIICSL